MTKSAFLISGALLLVGLTALTAVIYRPRIERDLTLRTGQALSGAAISYESVHLSGRDAEVRVRNRAASAAARTLATSVYGVRTASVRELPEFPLKLSATKLLGDPEKPGLILMGDVPDAGAQEVLRRAGEQVFGAANVRDSLGVNDGVTRSSSLQVFPKFLELLGAEKAVSSCQLEDAVFILDGITPDESERARIEARALKLVPPGMTLRNKIRIAEPERATAQEPPIPDPLAELEKIQLNFEFDSVRLTPESQPALLPLAEKLSAQKDLNLRIRGYTDIRGPAGYNLKLSARRAKAVAELLIARGVSSAAIQVEGRGATDFVADNGTEQGQAKNRRVEFRARKGH